MTKLEILKELNNLLGKEFSAMEDALDYLSEMFQKEYDTFDDAQTAFNSLDDDLGGYLAAHFEYTLGTQERYVDAIPVSDESGYITEWNLFYNSDVKDWQCLLSEIDNKVEDAMCNCGCDAMNALESICNEVFGENHPFIIECGELDPRINLLD